MIKILLAFLFAFAVFYWGIEFVQQLNTATKLSLIKKLAYAGLCSVLAISLLTTIVIIF